MGVTWSLTLREEQRLRVSQNRMLYCLLLIKEDIWAEESCCSRVVGVTRQQAVFYLQCSPNIVQVIKSRRMIWAGDVARMGDRKGAYRVLVGKPEGKRPLLRPRCRWEDNITVDLQEVGWVGMDWLDLAQDSKCGNEPSSSIKCSEIS